MTAYRRAFVAGATYFFTANLEDRTTTLLVDRIDLLRDSLRTVRERHPIRIDAMVVLPEHLHTLWTLPAGDADFSMRWRLFKAGFSRRLPSGETRSASRRTKHERHIWQRRFWEHWVRDDDDFRRHVDYIHFNPVKHGWVERVADWPHSSFHRFLAQGRLPANWGDVRAPTGAFGER